MPPTCSSRVKLVNKTSNWRVVPSLWASVHSSVCEATGASTPSAISRSSRLPSPCSISESMRRPTTSSGVQPSTRSIAGLW